MYQNRNIKCRAGSQNHCDELAQLKDSCSNQLPAVGNQSIVAGKSPTTPVQVDLQRKHAEFEGKIGVKEPVQHEDRYEINNNGHILQTARRPNPTKINTASCDCERAPGNALVEYETLASQTVQQNDPRCETV